MATPELTSPSIEWKTPLSQEMAKEAKKLEMPFDWEPPRIDGKWEGKSFISVEQLTPPDIVSVIKFVKYPFFGTGILSISA